MAAVKHTPGPWRMETVPTSCGICHKVGPFPGKRPEDKPRHACLYADYPSKGNPPDDELEANARLISAAPELLEACINALDMLSTDRQAFVDCNRLRDSRTGDPIAHGLVLVEEDVWITPEDAEPLRDYDRAISLLNAAIAKATGSAQ